MFLKNKRLQRLLADEGFQMDFDEDSENNFGFAQPMAHAGAGDVFFTGRAAPSTLR